MPFSGHSGQKRNGSGDTPQLFSQVAGESVRIRRLAEWDHEREAARQVGDLRVRQFIIANDFHAGILAQIVL